MARLELPAQLVAGDDRVVGQLVELQPDGRHWSALVEQPDGRRQRLWVAGRLVQAWAADAA